MPRNVTPSSTSVDASGHRFEDQVLITAHLRWTPKVVAGFSLGVIVAVSIALTVLYLGMLDNMYDPMWMFVLILPVLALFVMRGIMTFRVRGSTLESGLLSGVDLSKIA